MNKTGLVSVTFRKLSPHEIIELCACAKTDGIEWGGDVHVPAGQFAIAKEIGKITRDYGLETFSYGSYYKLNDGTDAFSIVSETAYALGANVIRIWTGFGEFSEEEYLRAIAEAKKIADIAAEKGQKICFEFHAGTINDNGLSCLKLLNDIGKTSVSTYWQPIYDFDSDINDIAQIKNKVENVHVFNWKSYEERYPLADGYEKWQKYIGALGGNHNYLLEFVKNDSPEQFIADMRTLNELVKD